LRRTKLNGEIYGKGQLAIQFRRVTDTIGGGQIYTFVDADIVNNSITRNDNYLP
jgi:rod shape-determining protein MreC